MTLRFSSNAAVAFGLFLSAIELWRRWGDWSKWLSIVDDVLAGALLIGSALVVWRCASVGRTLLVGAWAYSLHMLLFSFLHQAFDGNPIDASGCPAWIVVVIKGVFLALTVLALLAAIVGRVGDGGHGASTAGASPVADLR